MIELFKTQFGSRLYGTATPTSDTDLKVVVLPPLDDLLLGRRLVNKVKQTNTGPARNTPADVDTEYVPLQVYARDFLGGQTYALELAFAVDGTHADQKSTNDFRHFNNALRAMFLTSNVKAMVGYAVHQANLYSLKGERLNVLEHVQHVLAAVHTVYHSTALSKIPGFNDCSRVPELLANDPSNGKYLSVGFYDAAPDGSNKQPAFFLLEKTFPMSITLREAQSRVSNMLLNYGERSRQASEENVDWKAMMHATRVSYEALELLETGSLRLPFEKLRVDHLLGIKRGERPLVEVRDNLSFLLDQVKLAQETTRLPKHSPALEAEFEEFLVMALRAFYAL